ncbi:MAG: hypothetical protein HY717_03460 [Planctomycetes bacterium]|nr:hypothetical protein [Planctomycetota bacterium]
MNAPAINSPLATPGRCATCGRPLHRDPESWVLDFRRGDPRRPQGSRWALCSWCWTKAARDFHVGRLRRSSARETA